MLLVEFLLLSDDVAPFSTTALSCRGVLLPNEFETKNEELEQSVLHESSFTTAGELVLTTRTRTDVSPRVFLFCFFFFLFIITEKNLSLVTLNLCKSILSLLSLNYYILLVMKKCYLSWADAGTRRVLLTFSSVPIISSLNQKQLKCVMILIRKDSFHFLHSQPSSFSWCLTVTPIDFPNVK